MFVEIERQVKVHGRPLAAHGRPLAAHDLSATEYGSFAEM